MAPFATGKQMAMSAPQPKRKGIRLLGLPSEIRVMIWEHVLTGQRIVIKPRLSKQPVNPLRTLKPTEAIPLDYRLLTAHESSVLRGECPEESVLKDVNSETPPPRHLTAICKTCTDAYEETISLVYSGNTFFFNEAGLLQQFRETVPDSFQTKIRHIVIHNTQSPRRSRAPKNITNFWRGLQDVLTCSPLPSLHSFTVIHQSGSVLDLSYMFGDLRDFLRERMAEGRTPLMRISIVMSSDLDHALMAAADSKKWDPSAPDLLGEPALDLHWGREKELDAAKALMQTLMEEMK